MSENLRSIPENEIAEHSKAFISSGDIAQLAPLKPILRFDTYSTVSDDSDSETSNLINIDGSNANYDEPDDKERIQAKIERRMEKLGIESIVSAFKDNQNILCQHSKTVSMIIRKQSPSFLVIESLVWLICSAFEKDQDRRKQMFLALCKSMSAFNVLGTSYLEESLQPIRDSIAHKFNIEIRRVQHVLNNGVSLSDNSSLCQAITFDSDMIQFSDNSQLSEANRFLKDFEVLEVISIGGFGVVKKSRCKLDNCLYAVKEIELKYEGHESFGQIIREVKLYANLEPHPNVITYKTAWIQDWRFENSRRRDRTKSFAAEPDIVEVTTSTISTSSTEFESDSEVSSENDTDFTYTTNQSEAFNDEEEDYIMFDRNTKNDFNDNSNNSTVHNFDYLTSSPDYHGRAMHPLDPNEESHKVKIKAYLYIQMELCGINLRQYLDRRNQKISTEKNDKNLFELIDVNLECRHFLQILKGVKHIHSNEMIHRDLKPQNILFTQDESKIKIGDFGLATLHCSTNYQPMKNRSSGYAGHTQGLGTKIYAAPEQQNSNSYDYRVDMFSLGLILFELFHPALTEMERTDLRQNLKENRQLPEDMLSRWPKLGQLILRLTAYRPEDRPNTIADVMLQFREAFNKHLITDLSREEIFILFKENQYLKNQLCEKNQRIAELERLINK